MNIVFNALYKIDIAAGELTQLPLPDGNNDLKSYILQLLGKILEDSDKKGFEFQSETTEVRTLINKIINVANENIDEYLKYSTSIAERLLLKEIESDKKNNLKVDLVKGIAVISLVKFDNTTTKIIISKSDYNEYLDAQSYLNSTGFPLKKKVYKAFIAEFDAKNDIINVSVYDTNSSFTVYWWRDFLELREVYTDEYNTEKVFDIIESKVLTPIKKNHKADYLSLWSATVHYFRVKSEFSADGFIRDIFTTYKPFDETLDVGQLEEKAKKQFEKGKFDRQFTIVASVISKKFKKSIALTPQIDLNLKSDIQNLENTIKRHKEPNGNKWVMIKSDEGYEYFKDTNTM
jgi:hypothetical protein